LMVLGFCLFLNGRRFAAGVATGLSALSKEAGVIGLAIMLSFLILERVESGDLNIREAAEDAGRVVLGFAVPVILLSCAMAIWWNVSPSQQIQDITSLSTIRVDHYNLDGSYVDIDSSYAQFGNICPPWLWLLNRNPVEYFNRAIAGGLVVNYVGAMNPLLAYIMLPAVAYSIWRYWNTRSRADLFGLTWWAWSYIVYFPLAFAGRVMYLFYMLPVMGAISLMAANLMCHPKMNPYLRYLYTGTVIALMLLQFPVKPPL